MENKKQTILEKIQGIRYRLLTSGSGSKDMYVKNRSDRRRFYKLDGRQRRRHRAEIKHTSAAAIQRGGYWHLMRIARGEGVQVGGEMTRVPTEAQQRAAQRQVEAITRRVLRQNIAGQRGLANRQAAFDAGWVRAQEHMPWTTS